MVKEFALIPSYILMLMARPFFSDGHTWKHSPPTFYNWCKHATPLAVQINVCLVGCILVEILALFIWNIIGQIK